MKGHFLWPKCTTCHPGKQVNSLSLTQQNTSHVRVHCLFTASSAWGSIFPLNWAQISDLLLIPLTPQTSHYSNLLEVVVANLAKLIKCLYHHHYLPGLSVNPPLSTWQSSVTHLLFADCNLSRSAISALTVLLTLTTWLPLLSLFFISPPFLMLLFPIPHGIISRYAVPAQLLFPWADSPIFLSYYNLKLKGKYVWWAHPLEYSLSVSASFILMRYVDAFLKDSWYICGIYTVTVNTDFRARILANSFSGKVLHFSAR